MQQLKNVILSGCFVLTGAHQAAQSASPSLNSRCGYTVATPYNGTGVIFDETCTIAYVMPPTLGSAQISSFSPTTNLQFCSAVNDVKVVTESTFNSIKTIAKTIENLLKGFQPLEKIVQDLSIKVSDAKSAMEIAQRRAKNSEEKFQNLTRVFKEVKKDYERCIDINSAEHEECIDLKLQYAEAKNEARSYYNTELKANNTKAEDSLAEYDLLQSQFMQRQENYTDAVAPMIKLQENLASLNTRIMELNREYIKLDGGTGQIIWTIDWEEILEGYRLKNPNLRVQWAKLPIKHAELISTMKIDSTSSELGTIPAIRSAIIPGAKATGINGMGRGEKVEAFQTEPSLAYATNVFSNSLGGQIVFTLAGICHYFDGAERISDRNINNLTSHMVAKLIYSYEVSARRSYTARYNLSILLRKMEKKAEHGGLFSTSSFHSLIEGNDALDWFYIDFNANESAFQYSIQEQQELTRNIKRELLDKALQQFSVLHAGSSIPPLSPELSETGAEHASSTLRSCAHFYCQVGSFLLGTADSIWGKSDASIKFHRNNSAWAIESVNGIQFVERTGSLTFK